MKGRAEVFFPVGRAAAVARHRLWPALAFSGVLAWPGGPASAQTQTQVTTPPPAPDLRPFCTDRPTPATPPCTVDKGHFQVESDILNATYDDSGGRVVDTYLATNPTLKYGLGDNTDIEANIAPYEIVTTHTAGGPTQTIAGVSDLVLKLKQHVVGDQVNGLNLAVEPFLQLPTGRSGIGDGGVEGGLLVPIQAPVTKSVALVLTPEIDLRRDAQGSGVHPVEVEVASLAFSLPAKLTAFAAVTGMEDQDPSGAVTRCTGDVALAWLFGRDLQLDVGANLGLNAQTPAVQAYVGISHRF